MIDVNDIERKQTDTCARYGCEFVAAPPESKLGIAIRTVGASPVNGLRHPAEKDTNGWYLWCGTEFSQGADFFSPLHTSHVHESCPDVLPYLGLPPGYRFLLAGDHVDVWFDAELLDT